MRKRGAIETTNRARTAKMDAATNRQLVVKSNELIESSYYLTLQEKRIILLVASMIKPEDEEFEVYRFSVKEFTKLVGIKNEAGYAELKALTEKILKRVITLPRPKDGVLQIGWLSSAEYIGGEGIIELEFSPKLKPYLLKLKKFFTQYQLKNVISLRKFYSIRIYELLKQYETIRQRYFDLKELKNKLGILPEKYNLYGDIKRHVILPAQRELKKHTDIRFDFIEKKQSRKVIGITFLIKRNFKSAQTKVENLPQEIPNLELYQRVTGYFCFSPKEAKRLIGEYKESRLTDNLDYAEHMYKRGGIANIRGYTLKVIKENAKLQKSLFDTEKQEAEEAKKTEKRRKNQEKQRQISYSSYWNAEVEKCKEKLTSEDLDEIKKVAENEMEALGKSKNNSISFNFLVNQTIDEIIAKKSGALSYEKWLAQFHIVTMQNI